MTHAQHARKHAKRRATSRFGASVNRHDMRQFVADIQSGRTVPIWAQSNSRAWHLVRLNGAPAIAVYGKNTKTIHTFLTVAQARKTLRAERQTDALARLEAACAS